MKCGVANLAETQEKKGRPLKRAAALSMRIAPVTRDALAASAKQHGRNLTAEADRVLELGMLVDKLGPAGLRALLPVIVQFDKAGSDFAAENGIEGDWTKNPDAYGVALAFAVQELAEQFPGPWDGELVHAMMEQAFVMAQHRRARAAGLVRGEGFLSPEERAATSADTAAPAPAKGAA